MSDPDASKSGNGNGARRQDEPQSLTADLTSQGTSTVPEPAQPAAASEGNRPDHHPNKPYLHKFGIIGQIAVGVGLIFLAAMQLFVIRNQVDIAADYNRQNAIANRAFITSNEVNIDDEKKDGVIVGWMFRGVIRNSGNTPTRDAQYSATGSSGPFKPTIPVPGLPPQDADFGYYINIKNPHFPEAHNPRIVLGPHSEAKIGWIELTTDQIKKRSIGQWEAHISGSIHYWDQINPNVEHRTKFCYYIRTDSRIDDPARPVYDLCDYGNCIDDECKEDQRRYRAAVERAFRAVGQEVPADFFGSVPND